MRVRSLSYLVREVSMEISASTPWGHRKEDGGLSWEEHLDECKERAAVAERRRGPSRTWVTGSDKEIRL